MYRKLLSGTALLSVLAAAPALAADLSYPTKAPVAVVAVPVFSWTGFYLGASVGYGWTGVDGAAPYYDFYDVYDVSTSGGLDPDGWFGGFQAGYNYQFYNNVVLGIEADVLFPDMKKSYNFSYYAFDDDIDGDDVFVAGSYTAKVEAFGTIRARLGYAYDRFLPYITGGLAWANVKVSGSGTYQIDDNSPNTLYAGSYSDTYWGWAIGAGVEYAITDNWTVKAEYIYSDLGATSFSGLFNSNDLDFDIQTLKVGVNYKF